MYYLKTVVKYLNKRMPDLVMEQNIKFYKMDLMKVLDQLMVEERNNIIIAHRNKKCELNMTLEEFFTWDSNVKNKFEEASVNSTFFLENHSHYFIEASNQVWDEHNYKDTNIMEYVIHFYEAAKVSIEAFTGKILTEFQSYLSSFPISIEDIREPIWIFNGLRLEYKDHDRIEDIIRTQWDVAKDLHSSDRTSRIIKSKWFCKVLCEGTLVCPKCSQNHLNGLTHKECTNKNNVPAILWYWIKGETNYGICNGCEEIRKLEKYCCYSCSKIMGNILPPDASNFIK